MAEQNGSTNDSNGESRRGLLGRFGRSKARPEPSGSDWIDSRYTVDRSTATAALDELTDLASRAEPGTVRVRPEPDDSPPVDPSPVDRVVIVPETPAYDPRVRSIRHPNLSPPQVAPTTQRRPSRVVRPTKARRAYGPDGKPPEPDPHHGQLERLDARTAAWFSALVPSEVLGDTPTVVEVRDGAGQPVDETPTLETLAHMLLDIAPKTGSDSFKGLHIVLDSDGRRMELNIE